MGTEGRSEQLEKLLREKLGNQISDLKVELGDVVIRVDRDKLFETLKILKIDSQLAFSYFINVTAVDWLDAAPERFELVYHLLSITNKFRLRIKCAVPESDPRVKSATELWLGANYMEREVWDMFGIKFDGHPDLRRILLYEEFKGHPLRKDYPVQGKQPRIPLRHPEVENTARRMERPTLVGINPKRVNEKEQPAGNGSAARHG